MLKLFIPVYRDIRMYCRGILMIDYVVVLDQKFLDAVSDSDTLIYYTAHVEFELTFSLYRTYGISLMPAEGSEVFFCSCTEFV